MNPMQSIKENIQEGIKIISGERELSLMGGVWSSTGTFTFVHNEGSESFVSSSSDGLQWTFQKFSSTVNAQFPKVFGKDDIIVEIQIFDQKMGSKWWPLVRHQFIIFKTRNKLTGEEMWWSIEKDLEHILVQRSEIEAFVKDYRWDKDDGKKKERPEIDQVWKLNHKDFKLETNLPKVLAILIPKLKEKYTLDQRNCQKFVADLYREFTGNIWNTTVTSVNNYLRGESKQKMWQKGKDTETRTAFFDLYESLSAKEKKEMDERGPYHIAFIGEASIELSIDAVILNRKYQHGDTNMTKILFEAFHFQWPAGHIKELISKHGSALDAKVLGNNGQTLIMDAYKHINDKKLLLALRNGLPTDDLAAKDKDLNSIIHYATQNSDATNITHAVNVLKEKKLEKTIRDKNRKGDNPLHQAIKSRSSLKHLEVLMDHINMDEENADNKTSLEIAKEMECWEVVRLLESKQSKNRGKRKGDSINQDNNEGSKKPKSG